ncbi:succinylglutamate desuccinylase/aspartoacylase family protein [Natronolimnohabitans sp. A-GB9]|uniref:succinylglutamate desuccinylase/aspartoacylase family protein n=1 Tax=Natronolimnohabitans sp. A-GB9 TaxID=3069757 RepID=UPI0027B7BA17|nr:succinylglutamate desuccinylase/aspartoacylase family protein [Natronolimnohabitans sp. A-GB9]MDQ2052672.1 succinylglutamate desuccinylase/aspartoacylase family protein [Natronolimnohabitans sp. A-GB9]
MEYESVTHTTAERRLGRLPSGTDVSVTVHRYEGGTGPTAYVQAAQHGIELNGTAALRRLHHHLTTTELAGTVIAVPVVNSLAFDHGSYVTPQAVDAVNPNCNRVWPGDEDGTLQERVVARLWELLETADVVIDLHTGTPDMLEHVRFQPDDRQSRSLAATFGTEYLLTDTSADPETNDEEFQGKLRTAAARAGIPAIVPELSNSRQVDHDAARRGVQGVRNVLGELGLLREEPDPTPSQTILRHDEGRIGTDRSGLFEPNPSVTVGDYVTAGTELGTVYCPATFEQRQCVTASDDGVVYSLTRESVVTAGEKVACIAERTSDERTPA